MPIARYRVPLEYDFLLKPSGRSRHCHHSQFRSAMLTCFKLETQPIREERRNAAGRNEAKRKITIKITSNTPTNISLRVRPFFVWRCGESSFMVSRGGWWRDRYFEGRFADLRQILRQRYRRQSRDSHNSFFGDQKWGRSLHAVTPGSPGYWGV